MINMLDVLFHSMEEMKESNKCKLLPLHFNYWKIIISSAIFFFEGCQTGSFRMPFPMGMVLVKYINLPWGLSEANGQEHLYEIYINLADTCKCLNSEDTLEISRVIFYSLLCSFDGFCIYGLPINLIDVLEPAMKFDFNLFHYNFSQDGT